MITTSQSSRPADRQVEVETPELVAVAYELADLGSRFAALLVDGLILMFTLMVIWIGFPLLVLWIGELPEMVISGGIVLLVILNFALLWGYFVYFEAFRDGQTPGKRKLGLRVVRDGGYPVGLRAALVRNLLRVVDMFPPPTWLLGGATMMLHPQTKRIGDLAAGTIVVRERGEPALPEEQADGIGAGPPQLREDEFAMVARYVARRQDLPLDARLRISGQLLNAILPSLAIDPRGATYSAEGTLLRVYADESHRRANASRAGGSLHAASLARRQRAKWTEFRSLLGVAGARGLSGIPEDKVSRFAALYRETAADLARSRTYGASPELTYSLERWVGAGHNLLYRPGARSWRNLSAWLATGFPVLVRRRWRPIALAAVLLFGPMVATGGSVYRDPLRARAILPAQMLARAEEGATRREAGEGYVEMPEIWMPVMATGIIANNVQVAFIALAGGVVAGLGTAATLVFNGVSIGAVFGLFAAHGLSGYLLAFVLPHGVVELTAICIAGGAGLWLGSALVVPGRVTRREALVARGREAVALMAGAAVLLVAAGIVEGFISPAPFPMVVKVWVSGISALLVGAYLLMAGRE